MDRWDVLAILAAGYVATTALVRLMANRRNQLIDHIQGQITEQREKKAAAKAKKAAGEDRDVA